MVYEMNNEPKKDLIPCASYYKCGLIDPFSGGTKICQGDVHDSKWGANPESIWRFFKATLFTGLINKRSLVI